MNLLIESIIKNMVAIIHSQFSSSTANIRINPKYSFLILAVNFLQFGVASTPI